MAAAKGPRAAKGVPAKRPVRISDLAVKGEVKGGYIGETEKNLRTFGPS